MIVIPEKASNTAKPKGKAPGPGSFHLPMGRLRE
jgi:hypothetical protein